MVNRIMKNMITRKKRDTVKIPDFSGLISSGITQIKDLVNTVKSAILDKGSDGNNSKGVKENDKKLDQNIFYTQCPRKKMLSHH